MKKIISTLTLLGMAGWLVSASAQPAPDDNNGNPPPAADQPAAPAADDTSPPAMPPDMMMPGMVMPGMADAGAGTGAEQPREPVGITPSRNAQLGTRQTYPYQNGFMPPTNAIGTNVNDLNMNYRGAPLEMVLNYLADAAGFIIVQETQIRSTTTVTVNGKHMTRDDAVNLLNSVLNKSGLGIIRDGRTLTVVDRAGIGMREIPVITGNDPAQIPKNAEVVTQVIPIRFVEARGLLSQLSSFVSPQATVDANADGNSIIITDTQANIHHLVEIIRAIDNSAEAETVIQTFVLHHASPSDIASELSSLFPSSTSGGGFQMPTQFAGGRGGRGGGAGGAGNIFAAMMGGGGGGSSANDRVKKATAVTVVPSPRIQAVIVTAPKDLMVQIKEVIESLDVESERDQKPYVFTLKNADPQQVAQVLQSTFQTTQSRNTSSQNNQSQLQYRQQQGQTTSGQQMNSTGFGTSSSGGGRTGP